MKAYPKAGTIIIAVASFLIIISPLLAWIVFRVLGSESALGIKTDWFLFTGIMALVLYLIAIPMLIKILDRLSQKQYRSTSFEELIEKLENPDAKLEDVEQIAKELGRREDKRSLPYVLKAFGELVKNIEEDKYLLLMRKSAIIAFTDCLVKLSANTEEVVTLLNELMALLDKSFFDDPLLKSVKKKIKNLANNALKELS